MNVVIIDGDVSYPPTSGKRLRTLNLMIKLADRHNIVYLARADVNLRESKQVVEYFEDNGIHTILVHDPLARKSGPQFYARLAANLASPLPYSVATHQSRRMKAAVERHAAREKVDLWQCEASAYLSTLRRQPHARKLLVAHNVDSLIWQRYHEVERHPARKWYIGHQWRKFLRFERNAFREATYVVAVSEEDASLMKTQFGVKNVAIVDNGVDRDFFCQSNGVRKPNQILFLGALDWRPNQDAIQFFLDDAFPLIRQREPNAHLLIIGRNPPSWMFDIVKRTENVDLRADVPDVRPFLAESSVMIVPLRIGGGSRLKILESLAAGLPVVSTRIGAEGLCLHPGKHWVEGNSATELADATLDCLARPEWANELAAAGRDVVEHQYDWNSLADKLEKAWQKCVA